MSDHHHHHQQKNKKILFFAFILTFLFAVLEVSFGFIVHSLALLSEGFHMLSDGISLLLSFVAATLGMRAATSKRTFGHRRIETIAALFNGLALIAIPIYVLIEAVNRFFHPRDIASSQMLVIAIIGLIVNLIVAIVLSKGDHEHNLNLKAAAMHVLADLLSSVATIVAALVVMKFHFLLIDSIVSTIVSIVILIGGIKVTKEAYGVLMEEVPDDLPTEDIQQFISSLPHVSNIQSFHAWSIASGVNYLTVHIILQPEANEQNVLHTIQEELKKHHVHSTIQLGKA